MIKARFEESLDGTSRFIVVRPDQETSAASDEEFSHLREYLAKSNPDAPVTEVEKAAAEALLDQLAVVLVLNVDGRRIWSSPEEFVLEPKNRWAWTRGRVLKAVRESVQHGVSAPSWLRIVDPEGVSTGSASA